MRGPIPMLRRYVISPVGAVMAVLGVSVAVTGTAQAKHRVHPPSFAGLKSATTCIPGPVKPGESTSYHLEWEAAKDKTTGPRKIVYNVYQATSPGGENFSVPTYTTARGETSFDTPKLPVEGTFYFVVRARDRAGREDTNTVEREGRNLCK